MRFCHKCEHHHSYDTTCYDNFRGEYMRALKSADEPEVTRLREKMLEHVTLTVPDMDKITAEPWPGDVIVTVKQKQNLLLQALVTGIPSSVMALACFIIALT